MTMFNNEAIEKEAVDVKSLATNYVDIISDCDGVDGFDAKSAIQQNFPLATWLLNTPFARILRRRSADPQMFTKGQDGWQMSVPGSIWTLAPTAIGENECCWVAPDFAKCAGVVPMNLLCLKDCDSVFDSLVYDRLRINAKGAFAGIAREGESVADVNRRLNRLWMAFFSAKTIELGTVQNATNITKPFHGLVEVLENPAVMKIDGSSVLGGFDELACRAMVLGGMDNFVIWVHPLIKASIESVIRPDIYGNMPYGWARRGDAIYFHGMAIRESNSVPVDLSTGTGEAWVLDGNSVGAFLATTLMPEAQFIKTSGVDTSTDACGAKCDYYYNYGAVAGNNALRLAVIQDIPIANACTNSVADLGNILVPQTLIPGIA